MTGDDGYLRLVERSDALRRLAARIDVTLVDALIALAGRDTWLGPRADVCADDLRLVRAHVIEAEAEARRAAERLAQAAERLRQEQIRAGVRS